MSSISLACPECVSGARPVIAHIRASPRTVPTRSAATLLRQAGAFILACVFVRACVTRRGKGGGLGPFRDRCFLRAARKPFRRTGSRTLAHLYDCAEHILHPHWGPARVESVHAPIKFAGRCCRSGTYDPRVSGRRPEPLNIGSLDTALRRQLSASRGSNKADDELPEASDSHLETATVGPTSEAGRWQKLTSRSRFTRPQLDGVRKAVVPPQATPERGSRSVEKQAGRQQRPPAG